MYDLLIAPFVEFAFMRTALAGLMAMALIAPPIGVFLTLRRMSLTGEAIAHGMLPGAAAAYLIFGLSLPAMALGGFVAGLIVAVGSTQLARATATREDSSLAAFYLIALALGVTMLTVGGSTADLQAVLFGSVLALDPVSVMTLAIAATIVPLALALIWRPLVLDCVDPLYLAGASAWGHYVPAIFAALVVLSLTAGFQALGTLMAVGAMLLPAAIARFWRRQVGAMIALAVATALLSGIVGLLVSYHVETAAGPTIILTLGVLWALSLLLGPEGGLLRRRGRSGLRFA